MKLEGGQKDLDFCHPFFVVRGDEKVIFRMLIFSVLKVFCLTEP